MQVVLHYRLAGSGMPRKLKTLFRFLIARLFSASENSTSSPVQSEYLPIIENSAPREERMVSTVSNVCP